MSTNHYPEIAVEYLREDGWEVDITQVRSGIHILLCESGSSNSQGQLLTMVIDEPVESVTEDHIDYLIKTAQNMGVSKQAIITTAHLSGAVKRSIKNNDIHFISSDKVESVAEIDSNPKTNESNSDEFVNFDPAKESSSKKENEINDRYFNLSKSLFAGWAIVIILSMFDIYLNPTVLLGLLSGGIIFMFQDLSNNPFKLRGYSKWVWVIPTLFIPFLTVPLYWYSRYKI